MKKDRILSLILSVIMVVTIVFSTSVFAEEIEIQDGELKIEETVVAPAGEDAEAEAADQEEEQPDADQEEEEPVTDDQEEEEPAEEPEAAAEEDEEAVEPEAAGEESPAFAQGYVRVNDGTSVYATESKREELGSITGSAVAYAVVSKRAANEADSWLRIVFDTAEAKEAGEALLNGYVQFKDVIVLSDEEAKQLTESLKKDSTVRSFGEVLVPVVTLELIEEESVVDLDEEEEAAQESSLSTALAITTQPKSVAADVGETIQFTVEATGDDLTYQWQNSKNQTTWSNTGLTGYATSTLKVPVTEARYPYYWRCVITDANGDTLNTNVVQILKEEAETVVFEITAQPESIVAEVGETIQFTVEATGEGLTYQWQNSKNQTTWTNTGLKGNATKTLKVPVTEARYPYYWRCVITDANGDTLNTNVVQILKEEAETVVFEITAQPESIVAEVGETIQFTVEATGEGLTYQWQNSKNQTTWSNSGLSGSTTSTITVGVTEGRIGYYWRCVITDANGAELISDAALLSKIVEEFTENDVVYKFLSETEVALASYVGSESSVTIPTNVTFEGVDYMVTEVGEEAFYNNETLTSISLPNSITVIRKRAFAGCSKLSSMTSHE